MDSGQVGYQIQTVTGHPCVTAGGGKEATTSQNFQNQLHRVGARLKCNGSALKMHLFKAFGFSSGMPVFNFSYDLDDRKLIKVPHAAKIPAW